MPSRALGGSVDRAGARTQKALGTDDPAWWASKLTIETGRRIRRRLGVSTEAPDDCDDPLPEPARRYRRARDTAVMKDAGHTIAGGVEMSSRRRSSQSGPVSRTGGAYNIDGETLTGKRAVDVEPPVRADLVRRIRREIAEGTYETSERIEATVDRLVAEFFPEID
jgi:hypothetical protein